MGKEKDPKSTNMEKGKDLKNTNVGKGQTKAKAPRSTNIVTHTLKVENGRVDPGINHGRADHGTNHGGVNLQADPGRADRQTYLDGAGIPGRRWRVGNGKNHQRRGK